MPVAATEMAPLLPMLPENTETLSTRMALPLLEAPVIVPALMTLPENTVTPATCTSLPNSKPVWAIFPLLLMPPTNTDMLPT